MINFKDFFPKPPSWIKGYAILILVGIAIISLIANPTNEDFYLYAKVKYTCPPYVDKCMYSSRTGYFILFSKFECKYYNVDKEEYLSARYIGWMGNYFKVK